MACLSTVHNCVKAPATRLSMVVDPLPCHWRLRSWQSLQAHTAQRKGAWTRVLTHLMIRLRGIRQVRYWLRPMLRTNRSQTHGRSSSTEHKCGYIVSTQTPHSKHCCRTRRPCKLVIGNLVSRTCQFTTRVDLLALPSAAHITKSLAATLKTLDHECDDEHRCECSFQLLKLLRSAACAFSKQWLHTQIEARAATV